MGKAANERYVLDLLSCLYGVEGDEEELASEGVVLYRNELDASLLPHYFDEIQSEEEILVYFYSVDEYLVYIITELDEQEWLLVGILKDGKLAYNFVPE